LYITKVIQHGTRYGELISTKMRIIFPIAQRHPRVCRYSDSEFSRPAPEMALSSSSHRISVRTCRKSATGNGMKPANNRAAFRSFGMHQAEQLEMHQLIALKWRFLSTKDFVTAIH
jgi:hypothetical protein